MDESPAAHDGTSPQRRRGNTYKLLAECFQGPDEELLDLLAAVDDDLEVAVADLRAAATDLEALRVEYAKLFFGPFELLAPPYESTYVDDPERVMTASTAAVERAYRREGLDVDLDEPADHVAAELEFSYVLVRSEAAALAAGDFDAAATYLQRQYDFLSAHLGRWVSEFASDVREHASTEFYRLLADETRTFVETDGRRLRGRLDRLAAPEVDAADVVVGEDAEDD